LENKCGQDDPGLHLHPLWTLRASVKLFSELFNRKLREFHGYNHVLRDQFRTVSHLSPPRTDLRHV